MLRVLAASSVAPPLEIARFAMEQHLFELDQEAPRPVVRITGDATWTLTRQITAGAPAQIVITAEPAAMDELAAQGLIDPATRVHLANNPLVATVPLADTAAEGLEALRSAAVRRIALGDPDAVPAGRLARQFLQERGWWDELRPKLVYGKNVRHVVEIIRAGEADAAFIFQTDLLEAGPLRLLDLVPVPPAKVEVALVKGQPHEPLARQLHEWLVAPFGRFALSRHGFQLVDPLPSTTPAPSGGIELAP